MLFLDSKFAKNKLRYCLQCLMASVAVLMLLVILDAFSNTTVIAALGASSFIVFTMPHVKSSSPRFLIGGYLVGAGVGTLCYWLGKLVGDISLSGFELHPHVLFGAIAIGLSMFIMVITDTEHPPAAALALGLVLGEWSPKILVVVMGGIVVLCVLKRLLHNKLINLL